MLKDCFWAVVEVDENGEVTYCPLVYCMGCEECMGAWEASQERMEEREDTRNT